MSTNDGKSRKIQTRRKEYMSNNDGKAERYREEGKIT